MCFKDLFNKQKRNKSEKLLFFADRYKFTSLTAFRMFILKRTAFTLAEVLITLAIIGVVAAMTIPTLLKKYQEKVLVTRLKQVHSILSQAYLFAVAENGPIENWEIGTNNTAAGSRLFYKYFTPHMKGIQDCGTDSGCFYSGTYKSLFGSSYAHQPYKHDKYARATLSNGVGLAFWTAGSGCKTDFSEDGTGAYANICGKIYVDINGLQSPNRAGVDYFLFVVTATGIYPAGSSGYKDAYNLICKYNNTSSTNGAACTGWVILHENMDYLRRDISDEM